MTIKNCWTTGRVTTTKPSADSGKDCGALTGWFNKAKITITGFWTISEVVNPKADNMYVYRNGDDANITVTNSFSMKGSQPKYTNFTEEQLRSGEIAYRLNGDQQDIAWRQTIDTDDTPTLDASSDQVHYVGEAGYSTLYDVENDWALNGDAQAYIGTVNGSALHLTEINDIPAATAVVLSGTYYNKVSISATSSTSGNVLLGSDGTVTGGDGIYALALRNDVVGFYPVASSVRIPAGKAYLKLTDSPVKAFTFSFDDDATPISPLLTSPKEDGQVFDLAGRRIANRQSSNGKQPKGIYIINGKKTVR